MKTETKNKARLEILNFVIHSCTANYYDDNSNSFRKDGAGFYGGGLFGDASPPIGSLVKLMFAPTSKWYLGWLIEVQNDENFGRKFLIESIEDQSLCWWSNVSLMALPLEYSDRYPEWKWSDGQFEFKQRWFRACYKRRDAWRIKPMLPVFNDDGSVTLRLINHSFFNDSEQCSDKTFPNWKRVKVREMLEYYDKEFESKQ